MTKTTSSPDFRKTERIVVQLREEIVAGRRAPGERLPTRDEMVTSYGVSKVTVQRALDRLADDGFVVADGRRGTFVAHGAPHLTRYALLFPNPPGRPHNQLWAALTLEARALGGEARVTCIHGFHGRAGFLEYDRLLADVHADRLAGLIFASAPFNLEGTPLLEAAGIPRTIIMSRPKFGAPVISHEPLGFLRKACQHLAARGRQRPAMIAANHPPEWLDEVQAEFTAHGLEYTESWLQAVPLEGAHWAANLVRLLFDRPAPQRPDSLIVADDNLLEPASRALHHLGLRAPADVELVAECNFPWPTPSLLPVARIGYSITECLRLCRRNIDLARQGHTPPLQTFLPALTEREFAAPLRAPQALKLANAV
jgi:hypothetical protein